jgi:hypothetical protein
MTHEEVIKKLALNLAMETGTMEDLPVYRKYLQMALVIGIDHFDKRSTEIIAFTHNGAEVGRYKSIHDAGNKLGVSSANIFSCLKKHRNTVSGYMFVEKENIELIKREPEPIKPAEKIPEILKFRDLDYKRITH